MREKVNIFLKKNKFLIKLDLRNEHLVRFVKSRNWIFVKLEKINTQKVKRLEKMVNNTSVIGQKHSVFTKAQYQES